MTDYKRITVWTAALDAIPEACWPQLATLLDVEECKRAARFVFELHRRQFVAAHALKRLMLSAHAEGALGPADWTFETGAQGKPKISGASGPQFNLSHCDGLAACAVSHAVDIGVDVECLERPAPLELASCYFTAAECALLSEMPEARRPLGFFRLWTLKEAYIKATGLGLAQTLGDFAIALEPLRVSFANPGLGDDEEWQFWQTTIGPERYVLGLAWRGAPLPVEITPVALEALLAKAATGSATKRPTLPTMGGGACRPPESAG